MHNIKKIWHTIALMMCFGGRKKALYLKKHRIFGSVGDNCSIQSWRLPIYPKLVHIHDNVIVATDVRFVVHDAIFNMLNRKYKDSHFVEQIGCIEIMNNVFVGSGSRILQNVRIGNNVIIGAGSLVNKDVPDNSVYAGVPARYICSFDDYVNKCRAYSDGFEHKYGVWKINVRQENLFQLLYKDFCKKRNTIINES